MKILYLGTICNLQAYERDIQSFRHKPSIAPLIFETGLINGFYENNSDIDILSFPIYPAFPKCPKLYWGKKKETLQCGYKNTWLSAINIIGLKQLTLELSSSLALKKAILENKPDAILIYSIYLPVAKSIIKYAKKYDIPCFAIVPDLPRDMYNIHSKSNIKKKLSEFYINKAKKIQGKFDGYIYLTDAMSEEINPDKPYTVVEGIANIANINTNNTEKHKNRAIMYAGALNQIYGLDKLIEAFEQIDNDDIELWFFGSGNYASEIEEHANKDKRIKFFGRKTHKEILEFEKKATLLINVRNCNDEFTKYSFPSKTIEYMLSGTPLLTTELSGIPNEYFDYVFSIKDNSPISIKNKLLEILNHTDSELIEFGKRAQQFIIDNKSGYKQAKKIIEFINSN